MYALLANLVTLGQALPKTQCDQNSVLLTTLSCVKVKFFIWLK